MARQQDELFFPDIYSTIDGIAVHQNGRIIVVQDGDVERFVAEFQRVRRQQLIDDCRRIAEVA